MSRSLSQLFYALGGSVSPGKSNDELIDHLIDAEFIRTPAIQRVFRSVDRGNYYHPSHRQNAYKDIAWRMGNLHLSAPCVYSVVMETLKLKPGLSFLNLGSGSGYLSTMAGLLLGQYGINHGIEFHEDIVEYAYERLDEFLKKSKVVDEHDFCEPVFTCGNCLTLDANAQQYDRVYCGAACPEEYEAYIKNLVKINGILIMPLNDKLLKITRVNESTWTTVKVLSVSFAPLILPPPAKRGEVIEHAKLGDINPPTLQQLCRFKVRAHLRKNIETEYPKLKNIRKALPSQRKNLKLFVVNCGNVSDLDDSDSDGEDLDSFSLLMRSLHRTSFLLRNFSQVENVGSSEQNEGVELQVSEEDDEETEEVLRFSSLRTVRDAAEEEVDSSEGEEGAGGVIEEGSSTVVFYQDDDEELIDSLSEMENERRSVTETSDGSPELEKEAKGDTKTTGSSEMEKKRKLVTKATDEVGKNAKNKPNTRNRAKSVPKDSSKVEKKSTADPKTTGDLSKAKNEFNASVHEDSFFPSSSFDLSLPPSQSTRSRTSALKRKHSSLVDGPSTSAQSGLPASKKKICIKSVSKQQRSSSSEEKEAFSRAIKLDSNNKVSKELSHTYHLTQRIAALPLPPYLINYMNYKRGNF